MIDIVERLRSLAPLLTEAYCKSEAGFDQVCLQAAAEIERLTERCAAYKGQVEAGAHEIERLTRENWQLRQACGYPTPAELETVNNPFKCGTCDAHRQELEIERASQISAVNGMLRAERERDALRAALKEIATYDGHTWMYQRIARAALNEQSAVCSKCGAMVQFGACCDECSEPTDH